MLRVYNQKGRQKCVFKTKSYFKLVNYVKRRAREMHLTQEEYNSKYFYKRTKS